MNTTISNSAFSATIYHKGSELISFKNNAAPREYIWEGNPEFWGKHAPVLFPIVGTLKGNSYTFNGSSYALSRHGFARDREFKLVSQTQNEAVFVLRRDEETLQHYPFEFELQITYILKGSKLEITYKVINHGDIAMPFSIGAHPAFSLPQDFEDYTLEFEKAENLVSHQLENDLLSQTAVAIPMQQNRLPLFYALFEKDALIFKSMQSRKIRLLENNKPIIGFEFADFPNFGIWTKIGAPFICLEPWIGYSDRTDASGNIIEKEAIRMLAAQSEFRCRYSMEIL